MLLRPALVAAVLAGSAFAAPSDAAACSAAAVCLTASITGASQTCGAPSYYPYPHRHCNYSFSVNTAATALLPGNLSWVVSFTEGDSIGDGCDWVTGGCTSTGGTGTRLAVVNCGTTRSIKGTLTALAATATSSVPLTRTATVTFVAAPC